MLNSIQLLRAIACLMVVAAHSYIATAHRVLPSPYPSVEYGGFGVDIFFVISGFIMVLASDRLFGRSGAMKEFFARRIIRVVPLYWAATLVLAAAIYFVARNNTSVTWATLAQSLLFIPYVPQEGGLSPLVAVGWTLTYEMLFYVIFTFAMLGRRGAAVTGASLVMFALVALQALRPLPMPFSFWFQPIILEFVAGTWIACLYLGGLRLPGGLRLVLVLGSFAAAAAMEWQTTPWGFPRLLYWGLPAIVIVFAAVCGRPVEASGRIGRLFVYLGDASYSIYLIHLFALYAMRLPMNRIPGADALVPDWLYGSVLFVAGVAAGVAVFEMFEKPVLVRTMRWWRGHAGRHETPASPSSARAG